MTEQNSGAIADPAEEVRPLAAPMTDRQSLLATTAGRFLTDFMVSFYHVFEGDLVMALVFNEISLRNFSQLSRPLASPQGKGPQQWQALQKQLKKARITPGNIFSISEGTGIPRETVRRKVKKLEEMGWVVREPGGKLMVTQKPTELFVNLSMEVVPALLDCAGKMQGLIEAMEQSQAA